MSDAYNFTADQRARLAELLAEENRGMWSGVLYGIGAGDGEVVVVALSQLGNVGGNSGDSFRENRYAIGHYEIYGYGTPAY